MRARHLSTRPPRRPTPRPRSPRREERPSRGALRRCAAVLLALTLVASQLLSLLGVAAPAAGAAPSSMTMTGFSGGDNVGYYVFESDLGHAICPNAQVPDPEIGDAFGSPTPITQVSASDLSGVDPYSYAYFAAFAPLGGSHNDYGFAGSDANKGAATFVANVLLQGGSVNEKGQLAWADGTLISTNDIYTSKSDNRVLEGELPKIERLVADAHAHAGQSGWWDGSATYWRNASSSERQNLITFNHVEKYGGIELHKASADPSVSEGSVCYSLAGAVYGVYSDEACKSEVGRMTTDKDGNASIGNLAPRTYYVREISAPEGFATDTVTHEVQVSGGVSATLRVTDNPQNNPPSMTVAKVDADTGKAVPQGNASLAGAEFTVRYYNGYYDDVTSLPSSATRTWVLRTNDQGRAGLSADCKVSGDNFYYASTGEATLPLGTVTIQETKAPEGYLITDASVHLQKITSDGTLEAVDTFVAPVVKESAITGGIAVPKIDHELKKGVAQGDATLEGAVIGIYNASENAIDYQGKAVQPGAQVTTIKTDAEGRASTGARDLPYGNYSLKEEEPPEGYLKNESWNPTVSVQKDGAIVTAEQLEDAPERGSGAVTKVDADSLAATPQGDATLANAEITIWNRSEAAVLVDGVLYQPDDVVAVLNTSEKGEAGTSAAYLPYGTYEARETGASEGYLLNEDWSQTFEIRENGQAVKLENLPEPIVRGGVEIHKVDADTLESTPQGDATLAGAEFTVTNRSKSAVYVGDERYEVGEVVATLVTDERGEAATDQCALPYGTYEIAESKPSEGYRLPDGWARTIQVRAHGEVHDLTADANVVPEPVIRGGIEIQKVDCELASAGSGEANRPLGAATLAGAVFEVTNESEGAVWVGGSSYAPGEVVEPATMVTNESGHASTAPDLLPYGTYSVREVAHSEGYLVNGEWERTVKIRVQGQVESLASPEDATTEQVIRGDLNLQKSVDGGSRLAGIPFKVTSQTTGEWHLIVTDENGMADTSAEWSAHSARTNASDAALLANGTVDESKLDASAGVWFHGRADEKVAVDDALGALPYDTYDVEELRCAANEGMGLVSTTVTITRDGFGLDLGTFDDHEVGIGTSLSYGDGGSRSVPAAEGVRLTDEVSFEGLEAESEYRLEGELHALDAKDVDQGVVATATKEFTPNFGTGSEKVTFELDTNGLRGMRLVCFERLYQGTELVAEHADPTDEHQTLWVPAITTTLLSDATSEHDAPSWANGSVTDTVTLSNLVVGETYTVTGELRVRGFDGSDAGALVGKDGEPVTATTEVTATEPNMTAQLAFEVPSSRLAGVTLVAYETLSGGQGELASHRDISDEGQTVRLPLVVTEAISEATGDHQATQGEQTVTDTVGLRNLIVGREYTVTGELHLKDADGTDTGPLADAEGNPVTASRTFTAEAEDMELELAFEVDASQFGDRDIVAYETLTRDGMLLASHADIADGSQTVHVPELETTATSKATGDHNVPACEGQVVVDEVHATNLVVGKEYTVAGTLHVRQVTEDGFVTDGGALTDAEGDPVSASTTFTAEAEDQVVTLKFEVDASQLQEQAIVAFEELSSEDVMLTVHADINDEDQTVWVPSVTTTATDAADGDKEVTALEGQTVQDTVELSNLVVGTSYVVTGELHLVGTAEDGSITDEGALTDAEGNPVTATTSFVAEAPRQTVELSFSLDASQLGGHDLVAFERLSSGDVELAAHADAADEGQTVHVPNIATTLVEGTTGAHEYQIPEGEKVVTLTDTVAYENLMPGETYELRGTLHYRNVAKDGSAADGGTVTDEAGHELTAVAKLTPAEASGTAEVTFDVPAADLDGHAVVAFEELWRSGATVAVHADIADEAQTVVFATPDEEKTAVVTEPGEDYPNTSQGPGALIAVLGGATALGGSALYLTLRRRRGGSSS